MNNAEKIRKQIEHFLFEFPIVAPEFGMSKFEELLRSVVPVSSASNYDKGLSSLIQRRLAFTRLTRIMRTAVSIFGFSNRENILVSSAEFGFCAEIRVKLEISS